MKVELANENEVMRALEERASPKRSLMLSTVEDRYGAQN